MELPTETASLTSGLFSALLVYLYDSLVRLRQILRSLSTYVKANTFLLIVGALVAISGVYMNYNQTAIMVTADKIYECGPLAFGVDIEVPLSIWNIIQGLYNILLVLRGNFLSNVMRLNSAIVYSRQAILPTFNFINDIQDKTNPTGILATLRALYELPFMIGNLFIKIPIFQIPVFDTITQLIYLFFECLALLAEAVGLALLKGTLYSENCNVCEYKTQYLPASPPTTCYTTNFSALILTGEQAQVDCSNTTCTEIVCTLFECIGFSVQTAFSWTRPCLQFDITPYVTEVTQAGCCFASVGDRGLFIGVSVLEQLLYTVLFGSSNCMPLPELENQISLLTLQFLGCVDDLICSWTGGDVCNFVQMVINWIVNNILYFIDAIAALGTCAEQSVIAGCPQWPQDSCEIGSNGFADCVKTYTDCLQGQAQFWSLSFWTDLFDSVYNVLSVINGGFCGPFCIFSDPMVLCLSNFPDYSQCPSGVGPVTICYDVFETCILQYQFWDLLAALLNFIGEVLAIFDYAVCAIGGFADCLITPFGPGGPCNILTPVDPIQCIEDLAVCFNIPLPPAMAMTATSYGLWTVMLSPDVSDQTRVDACLFNGIIHDMNLCMNGCRYDPTSCLNQTYLDQWSDPLYATQRIGELRRTSRDLLRGKCSGAKVFQKDSHPLVIHTDFSLPSQRQRYGEYQACVMKENYDRLYNGLMNKTLPLLQRERRRVDREAKRTTSPVRHLDQCFISLDRYDDDHYMEEVKERLQLDPSITLREVNLMTRRLFDMFVRSAPVKYIRALSFTAKYNVSEDGQLRQEICDNAHHDKVVNLFHTSKERYVAINSMLLCNCLNSTERIQQYHALDKPHRVNGAGQMTCSDMKASVQRMVIATRMEHHKNTFEEDYDHMMRPVSRGSGGKNEPFLLRLYQNRFDSRLNGLAFTAQRYRALYKGRPSFLKTIMEPQWRNSVDRKSMLHRLTGLYGSPGSVGAVPNGGDNIDLFGNVLNNTFCFINGFSVIPTSMPAHPEPKEDFHAFSNGLPIDTTMYEMHHEEMKRIGFYEWLPFAERVGTSAVTHFGIDQYGVYKPLHMMFYSVATKQSHHIIRYMTGEYDWDMKRRQFIGASSASASGVDNYNIPGYPFPILEPPGQPIWDATVGPSTNLGIFVFFNVTLSTFFAWAGYDLNLQATSVFNSDYRSVSSQLYDVWRADDEVNCYQRGSYWPCLRLQRRAVVDNQTNHRVYNEPRQLFSISKEQFQSERAYQRYLAGLSTDPADFNANQWFEDLLNWLGTWLFGAAENAFTEVVDDVTEIVEQVNVTKELIILLYKLNVATACTWPVQVNGSTVYNVFCLPLLPATLGAWITALPTPILRPQIPWPQELIQDDCVNVYNGKSFSPTLSPNYLTQSVILQIVETGFALSNNCIVVPFYGEAVAASPLTNQMLVGAPGSGDAGGKSGAVFIYPKDQSTPVMQSLFALNVNQEERFGYAVEVWGLKMAVGAPTGQRFNGYVALYDYIGGQWALQTNLSYLDISNALTVANNLGFGGSPFFGGAVAMSDQVIAVGAPAYNASKGVVYLYRPGERTPYQSLKDLPAQPSYSLFGFCLAMPRQTSEWLFIGQPLWNASIGQVQVFRRNLTDGTYYQFQTLSFPDLLAATSFTNTTVRPQFGYSITMADDVPTVACVGAPFGFYSGSDGHVYCYKFNGVLWALSITIANPLVSVGQFGIGVEMNSTTLYVNTRLHDVIQVYQFTGAYTGVTLLYTIDLLPFSLNGTLSTALDFTDDGLWITGQPSINSVVYGFSGSNNGGRQIILSQNETEQRPFCPTGCDYCPRTYIEGGCRALKFKDFLDTASFLLALVPAALNFLFVDGLSLKYLENIYTPLLFLLDISRLQILLPNTRGFYLFLWFVQLIFQRDMVPFAPLLIITFVSVYLGLSIVLPFVPLVGEVLSKVTGSTFGFFFAMVAFLMIGQVVSLFVAFNGWSFSINQWIVDAVNSIQSTGYLFSILPGLDVIKFKASQFIYENPSDIPSVDTFCFFWTYYNLGLMIIAIPLAFYLFLIAVALVSNLWKFTTSVLSRLWTWMAIVFNSFRTNRS